jgi:hypothetical protein
MAKKEKTETVVEAVEQPKVDETVEKLKVKKKPKMKKLSQSNDEPIKLDLSKPPKKEEDVQSTDTNEESVVQEKVIEETTNEEKPVEQVAEENTETPILEEVIEEESNKKIEQPKIEEPKAILPEDVEKLVNFINETGGDLNDYINLNKDYDKLDNLSLLEEYYKQTKPHLSAEEINFLMEDNFNYDESYDDEKEIKRKKLALKEQVASAKSHLDGLKSKYYAELKAGSKLTPEQQKAIEFFNRYNEESVENQKLAKQAQDTFLQKTDNVFDQEFKGFEYSVGDKKYRFNVKDVNQTKETQADINNFVKKFLNEDNLMEDAKGYHKGLFTAMNADAIANHFYEQGKADALKNSIAKSKNINMDPRQSHSGNVGETGGIKFKVLEDNSPSFKFKVKSVKKK